MYNKTRTKLKSKAQKQNKNFIANLKNKKKTKKEAQMVAYPETTNNILNVVSVTSI